jgi:hypothetical protein
MRIRANRPYCNVFLYRHLLACPRKPPFNGLMKEIAAVTSALIIFAGAIPYARDVIAGRAIPSRSTRFMLVVIIFFALVQQHSLGSRWSLLLIAAELTMSIVMFALSLKYGIGGTDKLDLWCYGLLFFNLVVWGTTGSALIAIHITIAADVIACIPTFVKTYRDPTSETPLFWTAGAVAALLAIYAEALPSYGNLVFPIYLFLTNAAVALLAVRKVKVVTVGYGNDR